MGEYQGKGEGMKYLLRCIGVIGVIGFIFGCRDARPPSVSTGDERTEDTLNYVSLESLTSKMGQLKLGQTPEEVFRILGTPTSDREVMRKANKEIIGRSVNYIVTQHSRGDLNIKLDVYLSLWFKDGKLLKITPVNLGEPSK
jgi:hypothetical protein